MKYNPTQLIIEIKKIKIQNYFPFILRTCTQKRIELKILINRSRKINKVNVYKFKYFILKFAIINSTMIERHNQQATPSVYFNFDNSNQKSNELALDQSFVPFQYSLTKTKRESNSNIDQSNDKLQYQFVTPPSYMRSNICKNILETTNNNNVPHVSRNSSRFTNCNVQPISVKLDTEEFFQQFENNFVINFDDSPGKMQPVVVQFKKTFQSCPGEMGIKDSVNSRVDSFISEPFVRRLSMQRIQNENEEDVCTVKIEQKPKILSKNIKINQIQFQKQNKPPESTQCLVKKQSKLNCQIRKRILHKNSDRIFDKLSKNSSLNRKQIIKPQNLLVVSSSNWQRWTDAPKNRKNAIGMNSQPIKNNNMHKQKKKGQVNIFSSRQIFKQTLRSTTLDNWRKKFNLHKNQQKAKGNNIFYKPFCLLR